MSRALGRYLVRLYLTLFASMLLGVLVLFVVADFSDRLTLYVGQPLADVALLYWYKSQVALLQFGPAVMLLAAGTSVTLVRRRGEWTAMQALGFSRWMVVLPVTAAAVAIAVGLTVFDDVVVTGAGTRIDHLMVERFHRWGDFAAFYTPKRWFRVGPYVLNLRGDSDAQGVLHDVSVFELGPSFQILRRLDAEQMAPSANERWTLRGVVERRFDGPAATRVAQSAHELTLAGTSAETFRIQLGRPEQMPFRELYEQQAARARVGLSTGRFWYAFHNRVAWPASGLVGAVLAVLLALRPARRGTVALALIEGAAVSLVLFSSTLIGKALVLGEHLPAWGAAWAPVLILFLGSCAVWLGSEGRLSLGTGTSARARRTRG